MSERKSASDIEWRIEPTAKQLRQQAAGHRRLAETADNERRANWPPRHSPARCLRESGASPSAS